MIFRVLNHFVLRNIRFIEMLGVLMRARRMGATLSESGNRSLSFRSFISGLRKLA